MSSDEQFLFMIKAKTEPELKEFVNVKYDYFVSMHNIKHVSFGHNGACEFISALFLAEFDPTTTKKIYDNLDMYFASRIRNPMDFSDYMDTVVNNSRIKYETWSEAFAHFYYNHKSWIRYHPCAL